MKKVLAFLVVAAVLALAALALTEWGTPRTTSAGGVVELVASSPDSPDAQPSGWSPEPEVVTLAVALAAVGIAGVYSVATWSRGYQSSRASGGSGLMTAHEEAACGSPREPSTASMRRDDALHRSEARCRALEEELERDGALIQTVTDSKVIAAFVLQNDRLVYANQAAADITGYGEDELLSMHFLAIVHADDKELMTARRDAYLAGETSPVRYEFKLVRKDGEERWVDCCIGAPVDFEGAPAIVGTVFDITERRLTEEKLRLLREELKGRIEAGVPPASSYRLTSRELTVLSLASQGRQDTAIAAILGISHRTVEAHMTNLLRKMNARSRTEACVRAQREKIID